jgi:hypothetical protein
MRSQSSLMRPSEISESVEQSENSMTKEEGFSRKPPKDINLKKKTTRAYSKGPGGLPISIIKNKRLSANANLSQSRAERSSLYDKSALTSSQINLSSQNQNHLLVPPALSNSASAINALRLSLSNSKNRAEQHSYSEVKIKCATL